MKSLYLPFILCHPSLFAEPSIRLSAFYLSRFGSVVFLAVAVFFLYLHLCCSVRARFLLNHLLSAYLAVFVFFTTSIFFSPCVFFVSFPLQLSTSRASFYSRHVSVISVVSFFPFPRTIYCIYCIFELVVTSLSTSSANYERQTERYKDSGESVITMFTMIIRFRRNY